MASNVPVPAPGAAKDGPLSSFDRISKIIYLHRPKPARTPSEITTTTTTSSSSSPSPRLILLGGWMEAREAHLAKYTTALQSLYPDTPILLVRSFAYHFRSSTRFPAEVAPAAPLLRSLLAEASPSQQPQVLVLVFSNGGSTMLRLLREAYARSAQQGETSSFPPHVTVFDSAPGKLSWSRSVLAFSMGLARANFLVRLVGKLLIHGFVALYWLLHVPWGRPGSLGRTWAAHNDRDGNGAEVRRTYVYSGSDELIDERDVEEHAAVARGRGYEVRLERFEGTAHVAHVRGDEERYWRVIKETWEGSKA